MSIYDELAPETPAEPNAEPGNSPAVPVEVVEEAPPTEPGRKKMGCGCGSCLGGCAVVSVICLILVASGGLILWKTAPGWAHKTLVAAVEDSELDAADKQSVLTQINRVYNAYEADQVTIGQLVELGEELVESPIFAKAMAYAAVQNYVDPSGLSDQEKAAAERTLQRLARGIHEDRIVQERLKPALDYVSTEHGNGQRQFHEQVSDDDLRKMLAECRRLADNAGMPDEPFEVNIDRELKQAVDRALADPL